MRAFSAACRSRAFSFALGSISIFLASVANSRVFFVFFRSASWTQQMMARRPLPPSRMGFRRPVRLQSR